MGGFLKNMVREVQLTLSRLNLVLTLICSLDYAWCFSPQYFFEHLVGFFPLESTLKCASSVIAQVSLIH